MEISPRVADDCNTSPDCVETITVNSQLFTCRVSVHGRCHVSLAGLPVTRASLAVFYPVVYVIPLDSLHG